MKIWAVANQKGGVGKTTTVVSLGGWLSAGGQRALLVDLDPHGSMTSYFGHDPDSIPRSVYQIFQNKKAGIATQLDELILPTNFPGLHLLPAATAMATLDRQLGAQDGMGLVLKRALASVEDRYDVVLIDCLPMLGVLMVNALAACEQLIIPVQTEFLALKGLERMLHTLDMITRSLKMPMPYLIVPTMFDKRTRASVSTMRMLRTQYEDKVWRSMIPVDTQFREASRAGMPLPILNPEDRGSQAYQQLLKDLLNPRRRAAAEPRACA